MPKHRWATSGPHRSADRLQELFAVDAELPNRQETFKDQLIIRDGPWEPPSVRNLSPVRTEDGATRPVPTGDDGPAYRAAKRRWSPGRGAAMVLLGFVLTAGPALFIAKDWSAPEPVSVELTDRVETKDGGATGSAGAPGTGGISEPGSISGSTGNTDISGSTGPADGDPAGTAFQEPGGAPGTAVVHVSGAVAKPGVIEVPVGSRVFEALDKAGGAVPEADLAAINLAAPVQDGVQIRVPRVGETLEASVPVEEDGPAPNQAGVPNQPDAPGAKININTADAAELDALPRIGPVLASRIIEWRTEHGNFGRTEDLDAVPGIGPAMLESLIPLVMV